MRKKLTALILMSVLLLSACGSGGARGEGSPAGDQTEGQNAENSEGQAAQEELRWKLAETPLPDADAALGDAAPGEIEEHFYGMSGERIYRMAGVPGQEYIQTLEPPYTEWKTVTVSDVDWVAGKKCVLCRAALNGNGLQLILKDCEEGDGQNDAAGEESGETAAGWYRAEWTPEGGLQAEPVNSEYLNDELLDHTDFYYTSQDGTSYFMTAMDGLQYFDRAFQEKKTWRGTDWVWQFEENSGDGKVYFCGSSERGGFCIWTEQSGDPVFLSSDTALDSSGRVTFADGSAGYLCMPQGIWSFGLDSGELEKLADFQEEGYSVKKVYGAQVNEEGNLLMAVEADGERLLIERTADEGEQAQKELVLTVYSADTLLKQAVTAFNRQGGEYYIVLQERGKNENYSDYHTRIQVEIGSGNGPDIFDSDFVNLYDAAGKGLLRNLDEDLSEEKGRMLENAIAAGQVNGELFAVPYKFQLHTMVVSSEVVGDKEYWTPEEFMEYVRTSGAEEALFRTESMDLFWYLVRHSDLIDWESGKSDFNSSKAVECLEFAKEYGTPAEELEDVSPEAFLEATGKVHHGRTLAEEGVINALVYGEGMQFEAHYEGREVYIGYPVDDYPSQSGNLMRCTMLSINQACEYPEGAVAFIRYLLSQENQMRSAELTVTGYDDFPVDREALEYAFQYTRDHREEVIPSIVNEDTEYEYEDGVPSEETLEKIYHALMSAKAEVHNVEPVQNIIFEEASAYFNGDKTAEEICGNIQNRVQLYLDETH